MTSHVWVGPRCQRCGTLDTWPLAKLRCPMANIRSKPKVTRAEVSALLARGMKHSAVADVLNIGLRTITRILKRTA